MTPVWPVPRNERTVYTHGGRAFGAPRADGKRRHAGIDLVARRGDIVVAPEDANLVAWQNFNGPQAVALLLESASGVLLLGEVLPASWQEFGLQIGDYVARGHAVARVGVNPGGSTMLHFEMYRPGTRRNAQWYVGQAQPEQLVDPTPYLLAAAGGSVETQEHEHEHEQDLPETPIRSWASLFGLGVLLFALAKVWGRG